MLANPRRRFTADGAASARKRERPRAARGLLCPGELTEERETMSRFSDAVLKPALFVLAATAAVGCDSSDPITWSKAPADKTQFAVQASLSIGTEPAFELFSDARRDSGDPGNCPKATVNGPTTIFEASGCTSATGHIYSGRLEVTETGAE